MKIRSSFLISLKVFFAAMVLTVTFGLRGYAQFAEITALGGYTLGETFYSSDGFEIYLKDGGTYGLSLAYYPSENVDIAITYTRHETKVDVYDYIFGGYDQAIPASVNYIMIGVDKNHPVSPSTFLFGGLNLGTAGLEPKDDSYSGVWKFAFDIHAGAKIFPSPKVGIRLQAGINFPVQYFGAAFTVSSGGSGAGVSASGSITQVNFLGGLIFRLNKDQ